MNGVINVYKEKGMTSFGVVSRLRRIFNQKKIGHTGTLDPDAEGVLPVCLGKATRLVEDLSHGTKTYRAVLLLGKETDTQDISGEVLAESEVNVSGEEVKRAVCSFEGVTEQIPPMYSALKVNGKKLVDLARKGIEVERKPRKVEFSGIRILDLTLPEVTFEVTCSHGAYIRTLCHDIGKLLGCGGCMKTLLRTRVEEFVLEEALKLQQIAERVENGDTSFVIGIDHFYRQLPAVRVKETFFTPALNGRNIPPDQYRKESDPPSEEGQAGTIFQNARVRLHAPDGNLIGIYRYDRKVLYLEKFYYET